MKIIFNINYRTRWGESVYITGNIPELGNDDYANAIKMNLTGVETWKCEITPAKLRKLEYHFFVKTDSGTMRKEWGKAHTLNIGAGVKELIVISQWQDCPGDKHYYSSALIEGINKRRLQSKEDKISPDSIFISVKAPHISRDETLMICGDCETLGNWNPDAALRMNDSEFPKWTINIPTKLLPDEFKYKFIIVNSLTKELIAWENGADRYIRRECMPISSSEVVEGLRFYDPLPNWKSAGVAIPVFSLRSKEDFGVGDFYDLKKMIDWAAITGQNFVQLLPINDTTMTHTWSDSYPYNANSSFALHPMYIRLEEVSSLKDSAEKKQFEILKQELNALPEVDYERVNKAKTKYLKKIYAESGYKTLKLKKYKDFVDRNSYWLKPYAAFCVLRDKNGTVDYKLWGDMAIYNPQKVDAFISENIDDINFIYFIQYHLDKQLHEVRDYAHSKGVVIKGDIPIGISRTSVDAWSNPRLFNLDCQAGAPPDDFSITGQNWGFPTYNWEEMSKDGYQWWKNRFAKMAEYFDAYRIDHILGFFRIWEIPMDAVNGLLGRFSPALPYSTDEMRRKYEFCMNPDLYTRPYIMDWYLTEFCGEYVDEIKTNFIVARGNGRYDLHPKFATQRQVVNYFNSQEPNERNQTIKSILMGLIEQVLFMEDKTKRGHYHPRICAQSTYIYKSLSEHDKWAFDRLYNDFFYHRHNEFWYGQAIEKLPPLINSTDMLVCGEDLGMIPACVPAVMDSQKILSLEIQRMPKKSGEEFANCANYPYMSVAATSTHDMCGIRGWWEENHDMAQRFYNHVLHCDGVAPNKAEPWVCDRIITTHLESPSMLTILPLQDWLSIDGNLRRKNPKEEQINIPANPRHYWRYRMHVNLEDLLEANEFNDLIFNKINQSGR